MSSSSGTLWCIFHDVLVALYRIEGFFRELVAGLTFDSATYVMRSAVRVLASQAAGRNAKITDRLLLEKAQMLAAELGIGDFKASSGWLYNFKKRKGIALRQLCGESGSAETVSAVVGSAEVARKAVLQLIEK